MASFRRKAFEVRGIDARWLSPSHAANAFAFSMKSCSPSDYGLDAATVENSARHDVGSLTVASAWLAERFSAEGTVQIIFSEKDAAVVDASAFLAHWSNLFAPGRDDVFVSHNLGKTVFFYCHEDWLEVGERCV